MYILSRYEVVVISTSPSWNYSNMTQSKLLACLLAIPVSELQLAGSPPKLSHQIDARVVLLCFVDRDAAHCEHWCLPAPHWTVGQPDTCWVVVPTPRVPPTFHSLCEDSEFFIVGVAACVASLPWYSECARWVRAIPLTGLRPRPFTPQGLGPFGTFGPFGTDTVDLGSHLASNLLILFDFCFLALYIPPEAECFHVVAAPPVTRSFDDPVHSIYWRPCWIEALYNRRLCCGCCLVCAVADATEVPSSPAPVTVF